MKISPRLRCIYLFVIRRDFPSKRRLSPVRIYGPTQSVSQSNVYRVYLGGGKRMGAHARVSTFSFIAQRLALNLCIFIE